MLFPDVSCAAENSIMKHLDLGLYDIIKNDWIGIVTLTNKLKVYIDGKLDIGKITDKYATDFLEKYKEKIMNNFKAELFKEEDCDFIIIPIRSTEKYVVFYIFCKKGKEFNKIDLKWLNIYCKVSYENTLLKNESVQEKNYIKNIFESTESAIMAIDLNGEIVTVNNAVAKIFGLSEEENFEGKHYYDYIRPENKDDLLSKVNSVIKNEKKQYLEEIIFSNQNTERILNAVISPLKDSKNRIVGVILVGTDITDRSVMEHEIEQIKQFGLLGEISAGLAHDVKNPLMNIRGCARFMTRNKNLNKSHKEMLNIIVHEVDRINKVIEQMLSFGKVARSNIYTCLDINEAIKNCVQIINRQKYGKTIIISYDLDENIPFIKADNINIQQIILNILTNSVEAIMDTGFIDIFTKNIQNENIQIRIIDNGKGIKKNDMAKIFNPYYTNKANGTGLGLFTVKRILEQNKSTIDIISEEEKGTEIIITYPIERCD